MTTGVDGKARSAWRRVGMVMIFLLCGGMAWAGYRYWHHRQSPGRGESQIVLNLQRPDAVLSTRKLSELPKDVVSVSWLAGLVDEDLVFHYEEDEERLALEGTLRRLSFEHDLKLQDHFLATLLAAPAEIGFWQAAKGRPEYFVATLERGVLAKMVEVFAKVALNDRQLQQADEVRVGMRSTPVYTLSYGGQRTLVFAGHGDRCVVVSHAGMVLDGGNKLSAEGRSLLERLLRTERPWNERLPPVAGAKHSLAISPQTLSFGYSRFFPAVQGLRLYHDGQAWQSDLRVDAKALPAQTDLSAALPALWRAVPAGAGLCVALPVDWRAVKVPLNAVLEDTAAVDSMLNAMGPLAAACWYAGSRWSAPLFVTLSNKPWPQDASAVLAKLAAVAWSEPGVQQGQGERFGSTLASVHGVKTAGDEERKFTPSLLRRDAVLAFSPDARHVDAVLAVAEKRAVPVGDAMAPQSAVWLMAHPARLAQMVRAEVAEVLPADEESYLRDVARQRLWPRLDAWGKRQQAFVLVQGQATSDGFSSLMSKPLDGAASSAR